MDENIDSLLRSHLVNGSSFSPEMFQIARMCFACIFYHYEDLRDRMHSKNRLRISAIFISVGENKEIRQLATVRYPCDKTM